MKKIYGLMLVSFNLVACGSVDLKDYSYDYTVNGCATGNHHFSSVEELCKGLQDDKLNNDCAYGFREQKFKQSGCSGEFTSF